MLFNSGEGEDLSALVRLCLSPPGDYLNLLEVFSGSLDFLRADLFLSGVFFLPYSSNEEIGVLLLSLPICGDLSTDLLSSLDFLNGDPFKAL